MPVDMNGKTIDASDMLERVTVERDSLIAQRDTALASAEKAEASLASLRNFMLSRLSQDRIYCKTGICEHPAGAAISEIKRLDAMAARLAAECLAIRVFEAKCMTRFPQKEIEDASRAIGAARAAVDAAGDLKGGAA